MRSERIIRDVRRVNNLLDRLLDAGDLDHQERAALLGLIDDALLLARLKICESED